MKTTHEIMEAAFFQRDEDGIYVHKQCDTLVFDELPDLDVLVRNAIMVGTRLGREQAQRQMQLAIGIYK